jgi:hypothetical protein
LVPRSQPPRAGRRLNDFALMIARRRLANRRRSETIETEFRGAHFAITFSRFVDGGIAEVFIDPARIGSDLSEAARDAAIIVSLTLQHGVPLDQLRHSISRANGKPTSIAGFAIDLLADESVLVG